MFCLQNENIRPEISYTETISLHVSYLMECIAWHCIETSVSLPKMAQIPHMVLRNNKVFYKNTIIKHPNYFLTSLTTECRTAALCATMREVVIPVILLTIKILKLEDVAWSEGLLRWF